MASTNALIMFALSMAGSGGVECSGPTQHNGASAVRPYMGGIISVTKVGR